MKDREFNKWALVAYLVTLAMLIVTWRALPADNVIATFAKVMISQFYPFFIIVSVLSVYSICIRRWQPVLGGIYGNLLFFPFTITFVSIIGVAVIGPIPLWREGLHLLSVLSVVTYAVLVWVLIRLLMKLKNPNKPSHHTAGSRAIAQPPAAGER